MEAFLAILGFIIFGSIMLAVSNSGARKKQLKLLSITESDLIQCGKYTAGHPELNTPIPFVEILFKDSMLLIYGSADKVRPILNANIPIDKIKNILFEDATSIQKRVTVTRLLTTGIFAFALKKKDKNEIAYIIVEWNDGKFDHETIFEFSGLGSVQKANEARNKLIKVCK